MTRRYVSFAVVAFVSALTWVVIAPAAQADRGPTATLTVDRHVVHSGEQFTATAAASAECAWLLEWNGDRRTSKAASMMATFTAPQVTRPTRVALDGTCFYGPASDQAREGRSAARSTVASGPSQRLTVTVPASWTHTVVVIVLPVGTAVSPPAAADDGGNAGGLPGTGGPALEPLLAGIGAVLVGTVVALRSSSRSRSTGFRPPRALPAP